MRASRYGYLWSVKKLLDANANLSLTDQVVVIRIIIAKSNYY